MLGLDPARVREVLTRSRARARQLANFNSPTQIVISGELEAGATAGHSAMLDAGAKRVIPFNVSGAWHSRLMRAGRANV